MDKELLQEIYRRYSDELYLYLYSFCGNRAEAEDLMQEVFLKALLSLENTHRNFRAWLYLVAKNLCLNRMKRDREISTEEPEKLGQGSENAPLDQMIEEEGKRRLYAAILRLPRIRRQAILLQYFSGLSQKEIAQVLGVSPGNVRMIVHRGKKELKKELEGTDYEFSGDF